MSKILTFLLMGLLQIPLLSDPEFSNFALFDLEGKQNVFYSMLKEEKPETLFVLNFTSVDCKPCKIEIPELVELQKKNSRMKLLCIFSEAGDIALPVARSLGLGKAYSDPLETIQGIFGVKASYPTTVVVDTKGKKLATLVGYNEVNMKKLKAILEK